MDTTNRNDGLSDSSIFRFVWITFEFEKIKEDQDYLNKSISQGYEIAKEYQTPNGLVFSLIKNMEIHGGNTNQRIMEDFGFDSKKGELEK